MRVEMVDVRGTTLRDIADPAMKRKDIALDYAFGIRQGLPMDDWREINGAIIDRWSPAALIWIKQQAWKRVEER